MDTALNDLELLRRFSRSGDQDAFAELVRRYIGVVYRAALRQTGGRPDTAADITQQVFTLTARKARALEQHVTLVGWLHTTTRYLTRDALRAERRRRIHELEATAMHEILREESGIVWESVRPILDAAIGELPEHDREAVLLRFFAALPLAEVGRRCGISENAARMRVDRAVEKLGLQLRRHGLTSSAAALAETLVLPALAAPVVPSGLANTVTTIALAGGAPAGVLGGAIGFMSTKCVGIAAAALVVLGVIGTLVNQRRVAAENAVTGARQEHARILDSARRADEAAATAEKRVSAMRSRSEKNLAPETAVANTANAKRALPAATATPQRAELLAEGRAFLGRHREVKHALDEYVRASLKFRYGPLYHELGLTSAQIERFENLRGTGTNMGAKAADDRPMLLPFGDDQPPPDWDAQLREILGDEGARALTNYDRALPGRRVATEVASALYCAETPLTPAQAERLAATVTANSLPRSPSSSGAPDWDAVIRKAGDFLSAPQLEVLAGRRAGDLFQQVLNRPRGERPNPNRN